MDLVGQHVPAGRRFRFQLRRGHAGAGGLDVDGQLDKLLNGLRVVLETHDLGQGQGQAQGQFRLGQPAVAVMPEHPAHQPLATVPVGGLTAENAVAGDEDVVEPDHGIELVEPAAQRGQERVLVPGGGSPGHHLEARGIHRHDEPGVLAASGRHVVPRRYQQVLGEGRAGVHLDLAADHDAVGGVADQAHGGAVVLVRTEARADERSAAGVGQEPAALGQRLQVVPGHLDFLIGFAHPGKDVQQAQGDQRAVGRGVGDVSAAGEMGCADGLAQVSEIVGGFRRGEQDGLAVAAFVRLRQKCVLPFGVEVAVIPGRVLVHHGRCERVGGDVFHAALAQHPDVAPVVQALLVISPSSHVSPSSDGANPIDGFCPGSSQPIYVCGQT